MHNKALVAIKKVINPYVPIKIREDGKDVATRNARKIINPFDEIALSEAVALKNQGLLQEVIAVSIGSDSQDILLQALASGADRAIFINTKDIINNNLTSLNIAKILKYLIKQHEINLALLGKQAIDSDCGQTGPMLAGLLNWIQACFVSRIAMDNNNLNTLIVDREIEQGIERLQVNLPAVITVLDQKTNDIIPSYFSLASLNQAKSKPMEVILLSDLDLNLDLNSIEILKTNLIPKRTGINISSVQELIDKLKNKDKVL